ncbi:hypothetical protein, partial [Aeromonas caviae]|uniref:hypothetical protein n=1 Tax=Aeromonas caviae TaxID=648 RepID=UPI001CC7A7EE
MIKGHALLFALLTASRDLMVCSLNSKTPRHAGNAVHLSGAALRFTGKRVFDIFTALGLDGLGRFSMN